MTNHALDPPVADGLFPGSVGRGVDGGIAAGLPQRREDVGGQAAGDGATHPRPVQRPLPRAREAPGRRLALAGAVLARLVQVQLDWYRADLQPLYLLGLLSANLNPSGYVLAPTWLAEGAPPPRPSRPARGETPPREETGQRPEPPRLEPPSPVYLEFLRRSLTGIKLKDEVVLPSDGQVCDYFQIDAPPGKAYHSPSMGNRSFPLDPSKFHPDQLFYWVYDDRKLDANTRVRRVVFKASGVDMASIRTGPSGASPGRRDSFRPPRVRSSRTIYSRPIYVHCAADTGQRDAAIAGLARQRDEELADTAARTRDSLNDLRLLVAGHQSGRVRRHRRRQLRASTAGSVAVAASVRRRQPGIDPRFPSAAGRPPVAAGVTPHRRTAHEYAGAAAARLRARKAGGGGHLARAAHALGRPADHHRVRPAQAALRRSNTASCSAIVTPAPSR